MALSSFFNKRKKNQASQDASSHQVQELTVASIIPNRYQPRKVFRAESIAELAETIAEHGLLQPIVVREYEPEHYEIIAGERRFRAIKRLNWDKVPAIIDNMDDEETAAMALIENLQREELSPIEEAQAYQNLLAQKTINQTQLAQAVGKSQSFIANKLRLLKLPDTIQEAIINGEITERHGRAMLKLEAVDQQILLHKILSDHLTVKETEQEIKQLTAPASQKSPTAADEPSSAPAQLAKAATPAASTADTKKDAKQKRRRKRPQAKITGRSKDPKLAINTLRQSLKMIKDTGVAFEVEEFDENGKYKLIVKIDK